ncbi:MAG: acetylornithine transaminase [Caldicoprobacterales bacterium]|jgi:acetylornithine/N-succinyldiaminopimelate aminotransferase
MDYKEVKELDEKYYFNTFGSRLPVSFEYGEGCTLYDSQGKKYTDFVAGIAVNTLGYNHPALVEAITSQSEKLLHCSNLFYIKAQAQLAKLLVENSCGDKVFLCNSGAEANEGAIKLARKYFYSKNLYKYEIITTLNSFHGRTMATLAATGQEKYQKPFEPLPTGFVHVPFNDIEAVENAISYKTCAVMVEPIQGEGGVIPATAEYMQALRKLCDDRGILLIFDEVQTGIGRTGKLFGYEQYGIEPDIFTLAKGLGGGIPIGAIVAKAFVASAMEPGDHGTTFGGNPLACTAALAVLSTILEEGILETVKDKGEYFTDQLIKLKNKFSFIKEVRGKGLMLGVELDEEVSGKEIVLDMLNRGFIINCAGNNTLRFVPPLIIQKDHIDDLVENLEKSFSRESYDA